MKRQKTDGLDRQLSYRFKQALGDHGCADWLDVRERAGMGRTLWRWSQRRVLLVAGGLVLAVGAAGASTGIIPWLGNTPKPVPPTVYPICKAKDVQGELQLRVFKVKRELSGSIVLVNTGESACALEGQPRISLSGPGADSVRFRAEMFSPLAGTPQANVNLFDTGPANQTLLGRNSASPAVSSSVSFSWQNWCGPASAKPSLRFEIPNGTILDLPITKLPPCIDQ